MKNNINKWESKDIKNWFSLISIKNNFSNKIFLILSWLLYSSQINIWDNFDNSHTLATANIDIPCWENDTKLLYFRQIHWTWYENDSFNLSILETIKSNQEIIYTILKNLTQHVKMKVALEWIDITHLENFSYKEIYEFTIKNYVTWFLEPLTVLAEIEQLSAELEYLTWLENMPLDIVSQKLSLLKHLNIKFWEVSYLNSLRYEYGIVWWAWFKLANEWKIKIIPWEDKIISDFIDKVIEEKNISLTEFAYKYPNYVFEFRENEVLKNIKKYWDKSATNAIIYWWMHEFSDNVEKWNQVNPDFQFCLTTISPNWIQKFIKK